MRPRQSVVLQNRTRPRLLTCCSIDLRWWRPSQFNAFVVVIANQYKISLNAFRGNEPLQQRCGKLDRLPAGSLDHYAVDRAAIIIQILFRRYVEVKCVLIHTTAGLVSECIRLP